MSFLADMETTKHREAIRGLACTTSALLQVLVDRGLVTIEEFTKITMQQQAALDQLAAEHRDKQLAGMNQVERMIYDSTGFIIPKEE